MNMHVPTSKIKTQDGNTVSRRSILGAAPAAGLAAFLIGATPVKAAPAHDPLPSWFAEWKKWRKVELDLSERPEGGDFDMPEQLAAAARYDALSEKIARSRRLRIDWASRLAVAGLRFCSRFST